MHVAQFVQRYPPALGGSEAYADRLTRYLVGRGDGVAVFTSTAVGLAEMWRLAVACGERGASAPRENPGDSGALPLPRGADAPPLNEASFLAASPASFTSDAFTSSRVGGSGRCRGISTRSTPGGRSARVNRNASRKSRLYRLRATAPPTFRDTDTPSRGCGRPFSQAYTTRQPSAADRFR